MMDAHLKHLAEAGLRLDDAEAALDAGGATGARDHLDAADDQLGAVRSAWPAMSGAERAVVARTAGPFRARLDAGRARLPKATALVAVAPEPGEADDQETPPEE